MRCIPLTSILALAVSGLAAAPALGAPDPAGAAEVFRQAKAISDRDGGQFWGKPLYGPMIIVDPTDSAVLANQADPEGRLKPAGALFAGALSPSDIVANTPVEWSGARWTELLWPVTLDVAHRRVMLAHEMFHRIQPSLGLLGPEGGNQHLDTLEGRYLLQLEWRALARALQAKGLAARKAAVADALLFRHERYRLFPAAAADEGRLEINEGIPEYTGVRLGLATPAERVAYAVQDLSAFVGAPSFVRSFAYATDPSYGLLLDQADPTWRTKIASGRRLDELLEAAMGLPAPASAEAAKARAAAYDDGTLRAAEEKRETARQARLAELKARLVDGPVLVLPLHKISYQFNPQTLVPLEGYGIVYPSMRITSDWGTLEVEDGALLDEKMSAARVSAIGMAPSGLRGRGWQLTLKPGWAVKPGQRQGDLTVVADKPAG